MPTNDKEVKVKMKVRLVGIVRRASDATQNGVLVRPIRQPPGHEVAIWLDPRIVEIIDE
jgi:hypothetical protein